MSDWHRWTEVAPKVMPPIYFHGNQQIQRAQYYCLIEHILSYKTLFFNTDTTINKHLQAVFIKICLTYRNVACLSRCCHHCWNTPRTTSVCSHPLFGLHWWMSMGAIFSAWRNLVPPLYSIHTSMSDAILSDCPPTAICHKAKKYNEILTGRFNFYCHPSTIHLWCCGPTS